MPEQLNLRVGVEYYVEGEGWIDEKPKVARFTGRIVPRKRKGAFYKFVDEAGKCCFAQACEIHGAKIRATVA
jgi:hypothetical protein